MSGWSVSARRRGSSRGSVPVVPATRACLRVEAIHFAVAGTGSSDWHYLYRNGNSHSLLPASRDINWWGRGNKITIPEWERSRRDNDDFRACFERKKAIAFKVKLVTQAARDATGDITVTPQLDGSTRHLQPGTVSFTYPAGQSEHWVSVALGGAMPDEVGRYQLRLRWDIGGTAFRFCGPLETRHRIYGIYGPPLEADYDSASVADTGMRAPRADGTVTGTRKRFDHMMRLIGGSDLRRVAASRDNLVDLYWELHKGINDTPGAPPYFDAGHDKHMTVDGTDTGTPIPVEDQWLAWVRNAAHWNDASCIGHVQIAKTMLAAVGLFARRTWVFPHTTRMPDGSTVSFADTDLYSLGDHDDTKMQKWTFTFSGRTLEASPKLMEPNVAWENFEACMLSPTGKFLTGGYNTASNPPSFRRDKGFNSAAQLLHWWSRTRRGSFQRFMCWIYFNRATNEFHAWDVNGAHYTESNVYDIGRRGLELPPPPAP